jgi:uncharacterized protein YbbC (DUF1343 family)
VSEGRGTESPFLLFGAPWMEPRLLLARLDVPGFRLEAEAFTPKASAAAPGPKYEGTACAGVRVRPEGPSPIRGYKLGLTLLQRLRAVEPQFRFLREGAVLDTLLGTMSVRAAIERRERVEAILARDQPATLAFRRERAAILLY